MRRMQRGLMAAHEQQVAVEAEQLALEGVKGAAVGFVTGLISSPLGLGGIHGAVLKNQVLKKREEIQALAKEIAKVSADAGKKAVDEGKLDAETYKKEVDIGWKGVIGGFFGGGFFGPWYTAVRTSQLEDLNKQMKKDVAELQRMLDKAKLGTVATEGLAGAAGGAIAGLFFGGISGAVITHQIEQKRAEIEATAKALQKVALDNGKKAVEEGKITAEDFSKEVDVGLKGIIGGAIWGTLFGPIYGALAGHELEEQHKKLKKQCAELNKILEKAQGKPAQESAPVEDHSQSAETDLIAIADHEAESAAAHHDMDQAADVACALESLSLAMRTASENGGLSRDGARVAHVAAESLCKSIGLSSALKSMPSLESYGSVNSRVVATNLALEDLVEKAKLIWAKIVEAIKKSIAWIKERFALMFSVAGKLKSRSEGLAAAAGKVEGEAEESEVDNARLFNALSIDGKVDGLISGMEYVAGHAAEVYSGAEQRMEALLAATEAKSEGDMFKALAGLANVNTSGGELTNADGKATWTSPTLPGGKALVIVLPSEEQLSGGNITDVARAVTSASASVQHVGGDAAEGKLPVLSPADAAKLATVCAKAAGAVFAFEQSLKKISDQKAKASANAEAMANAEGDSEEAKLSRQMGPVFMAMGKLVDNPVTGFSAYILNTVKAACDYVAISIKRPGMVDKAADAVGDAAEATAAGAKKVGEAAGQAADKVKETAGKVGDKVKEAAGKTAEAAGDAAMAVKNGAKKAADATVDAAGKVIDKVKPKAA